MEPNGTAPKNEDEPQNSEKATKQFPKWYKELHTWLDLGEPLKNRPKFGMRIIKTGLAVFVTAVLYMFLGRSDSSVFLALIAGVVSMQDTMGHSVRMGVIRLMGTAIGGIIGIVLTWAITVLNVKEIEFIRAIVLAIGTMLCIVTCVWLDLRDGSVISVVVCQAILIQEPVSHSYIYALNRILDTAIGIVVSVVINVIIRKPPTIDDRKQKIEEIKELKYETRELQDEAEQLDQESKQLEEKMTEEESSAARNKKRKKKRK